MSVPLRYLADMTVHKLRKDRVLGGGHFVVMWYYSNRAY
jgi:hypothetical protein